jgi:hypothetical protein
MACLLHIWVRLTKQAPWRMCGCQGQTVSVYGVRRSCGKCEFAWPDCGVCVFEWPFPGRCAFAWRDWVCMARLSLRSAEWSLWVTEWSVASVGVRYLIAACLCFLGGTSCRSWLVTAWPWRFWNCGEWEHEWLDLVSLVVVDKLTIEYVWPGFEWWWLSSLGNSPRWAGATEWLHAAAKAWTAAAVVVKESHVSKML